MLKHLILSESAPLNSNVEAVEKPNVQPKVGHPTGAEFLAPVSFHAVDFSLAVSPAPNFRDRVFACAARRAYRLPLLPIPMMRQLLNVQKRIQIVYQTEEFPLPVHLLLSSETVERASSYGA